jgi:hypothetical protein
MKISLWPLALIFYVDTLDEGVAGQARGPVVMIRKEYAKDVGLEMHELTHVVQWWVTFGMHPILYLLWREYRLWSEAKAYKKQMQYPNSEGGFMTLEEASVKLCWDRYQLDLTLAEAYAALSAL